MVAVGVDRVVIHPKVEPAYARYRAAANRRQQPAEGVWRSLKRSMIQVKQNPTCGVAIPRPAILDYFTRAYGVTNLYFLDLASFGRVFYTLVGRTAYFLDFEDYTVLDRLFSEAYRQGPYDPESSSGAKPGHSPRQS